jgi:hypothetical protein
MENQWTPSTTNHCEGESEWTYADGACTTLGKKCQDHAYYPESMCTGAQYSSFREYTCTNTCTPDPIGYQWYNQGSPNNLIYNGQFMGPTTTPPNTTINSACSSLGYTERFADEFDSSYDSGYASQAPNGMCVEYGDGNVGSPTYIFDGAGSTRHTYWRKP